MGSLPINNDNPKDGLIFILNSFPGTVKIVKLTYPIDDSAGCFRLKYGESTMINLNMKISTTLHVYVMSIFLMEIDDLRLLSYGSTIEIT